MTVANTKKKLNENTSRNTNATGTSAIVRRDCPLLLHAAANVVLYV
jgi:hypothetical protein